MQSITALGTLFLIRTLNDWRALLTRIGLLSDAHGRGPITQQAVALLLDRGAELLLYLGDVGSEAVIDALAVGDRAQSRLVFGNTDYDTAALEQYARQIGVHVDDPVGCLETARGPLVYCHGHDEKPMQMALAQGAAYLCHGHTHVQADRHLGATRIINPGALHRAREYTAALLDPQRDELMFYRIDAAC